MAAYFLNSSASSVSRLPISKALSLFVVVLALLTTLFVLVLSPFIRQTVAKSLPKPHNIEKQYPPNSLGAVASESSICSKIGIEQYQNGGNAADSVRYLCTWTAVL